MSCGLRRARRHARDVDAPCRLDAVAVFTGKRGLRFPVNTARPVPGAGQHAARRSRVVDGTAPAPVIGLSTFGGAQPPSGDSPDCAGS